MVKNTYSTMSEDIGQFGDNVPQVDEDIVKREVRFFFFFFFKNKSFR